VNINYNIKFDAFQLLLDKWFQRYAWLLSYIVIVLYFYLRRDTNDFPIYLLSIINSTAVKFIFVYTLLPLSIIAGMIIVFYIHVKFLEYKGIYDPFELLKYHKPKHFKPFIYPLIIVFLFEIFLLIDK